MEAGGTFDTEASLDANRLVFVDETGTSTKMVRTTAAVAAASV